MGWDDSKSSPDPSGESSAFLPSRSQFMGRVSSTDHSASDAGASRFAADGHLKPSVISSGSFPLF